MVESEGGRDIGGGNPLPNIYTIHWRVPESIEKIAAEVVGL